MDPLQLLTIKPVLFVANVAEAQLRNPLDLWLRLEAWTKGQEVQVIAICARLEAELADFSPEDRQAFLSELGLPSSALTRLIQGVTELLGLLTFYTVNETEGRGWMVPSGTRAIQAARKVHTDMERGFIRVEVTTFEDLQRCGSPGEVKEKGLLRIEGRDYLIKDGDILFFRFHV